MTHEKTPQMNHPTPPVSRRVALSGLTGLGLLGLTACSSDPNSVAEQAKAGDRKGYVSGDGSIVKIQEVDRLTPVTLAGDTVDGKSWDIASASDRAVVVNVWGSWCPPCVAEAADLQKVWDEVSTAKKPVDFIGIDFREDAATGLAFLKSRGITYPSLSDESGVAILALQGKAVATPSTIVLDQKHRIAAVVSGPVDDTTLSGLIDDVLAGT